MSKQPDEYTLKKINDIIERNKKSNILSEVNDPPGSSERIGYVVGKTEPFFISVEDLEKIEYYPVSYCFYLKRNAKIKFYSREEFETFVDMLDLTNFYWFAEVENVNAFPKLCKAERR